MAERRDYKAIQDAFHRLALRYAPDLYVALQVGIPEKLSSAEKKLWKRLHALEQEENG